MGYNRPDQLTIQWNGTSFVQCLIDYLPFSAPTRPRLQPRFEQARTITPRKRWH